LRNGRRRIGGVSGDGSSDGTEPAVLVHAGEPRFQVRSTWHRLFGVKRSICYLAF